MTSGERRTQAERTSATRTALLGAAREAFTRDGYAASATEDIVAAAGVTRGALYHHFGDKRGLFEAVYVDLEEELADRVAAGLSGTADFWGGVRSALGGFLRACAEPGVMRIALLDAPTVLGWDRWRELEARYGLGVLTQALGYGQDQGFIVDVQVAPMAEVLFGALTQAALTIAHAGDQEEAIVETEAALLRLIDGLRA